MQITVTYSKGFEPKPHDLVAAFGNMGLSTIEVTKEKIVALQDVLLQLKQRATFAEQWPDEWQAGLTKGKQRVLELESIRGDSYTMADILKINPDIYDWYHAIAA